MTDQEMFNRAWRGLRSQGFERCVRNGELRGVCVVMNEEGMRCAGSWIMAGEPWDDAEPSLSRTDGLRRIQLMGSVVVFRNREEPLGLQVQRAHDLALCAAGVENNLRELAAIAGLEIPNG